MAPDLKSATFHPIAPEDRPQDPLMDGAGWKYTNLEHGGDYPDTMPQAIRATDAQGRSCVYVVLEVDGQIGEWTVETDSARQ